MNRRQTDHLDADPPAFTLIEVMIAVAIFFVAMFALLALLNSGIHAASILRRNAPTAGMAVAESGLMVTNKLEAEYKSGDFGEVYPDFAWQENVSLVATNGQNGLFQVEVEIFRRGAPYTSTSILLYKPISPH